MNLGNMLIKVINDAWGKGILTGFLVILYLWSKHMIPLIEKRFKNKHVNSALNATERFAGMIIPEVAKMSSLSNSDRKAEAVRFVSMQLMKHGFDVSHKSIDCIVEKVYQYMKGVGHLDIDKPKSTLDPTQMTPEQISKLTPPDANNK